MSQARSKCSFAGLVVAVLGLVISSCPMLWGCVIYKEGLHLKDTVSTWLVLAGHLHAAYSPDCAVLPAGLQSFPGVDKYVKALLEARKGKNMTQDVALDAVTNDVNMFGVMMVAMGDAGGMVSGSIHTTAATIRPAMQVLKTPNLVSSIFFMCLPDKVSEGTAEKLR